MNDLEWQKRTLNRQHLTIKHDDMRDKKVKKALTTRRCLHRKYNRSHVDNWENTKAIGRKS
jgi:hypothetical protein